MSSTLSALSSNTPSMDYPDDMFNVMSDIVTRRIVSYPDASSSAQSLTIGSTADIAFESKGNTNLHVDPTKEVKFYHTSIDSETRNENLFLNLSASNNSTELLAPNSRLRLSPGDTDKTTNVGSMTVNENSVSQLLTTDKSEFKVMKNMSVLGDFNLTGQFFTPQLNAVNLTIDNSINVTHQVTNGSMYGNNMNIWINKDDDPGDRLTNQIGYGFKINSNTEQLELFKYKRFSFTDSNGNTTKSGKTQYRKVCHFGFGVTTYDKESDVTDADILTTFNTLDVLTSGRSNVSSSNAIGTSGSAFWTLNSNANIYYYGNIGINKSVPKYSIDVNGSISASDTVIANNYATASDMRIKTDITRLENAVCLDKIKMLMPSSFTLTTDSSRKSGFIAQELREVIPDAVNIKENSSIGIDDFHYVDYNSIISHLVGAVQELSKKINAIESTNRQTQRYLRF